MGRGTAITRLRQEYGRQLLLWTAPVVFLLLVALWWFSLPGELFQNAPGMLILDREGRPLDMRIADDEQWRFAPAGPQPDSVTGSTSALHAVPPQYEAAVLHFEDKNFYHHPGFDFIAILRAAWQNLRAGRVVSGGSTISMQVIRLSRGTTTRTYREKIIELLLAIRLEIRYSKSEILRLYADNAPFGGNIVGLEAAAWRYFNRSPQELSWAEAALLAVLPNNPAHIHLDRDRRALQQRRDELLQSLSVAGYLTEVDVQAALLEPLPAGTWQVARHAPGLAVRAAIDGHDGSTVYTTIDGELQRRLLTAAERQARVLYSREVRNMAVLVLDLASSTVVGYLGNTPLSHSDIPGRDVDIIRSLRSSGSLLKPFLYAAMQDSGEMLPTELLVDIPMRFGSYAPRNHTKAFLGAIPADQALSRSLNVPFVHALSRFGVPRFKELLEDLGMTTLHRPSEEYGLPLIIGGAETTLWEITSIFAALTRMTIDHTSIAAERQLRFPRLYRPAQSEESPDDWPAFTSPISPQAWYLTLKALQQVDRPGIDSAWQHFATGSPIAWKTGTSQGSRDAWAIGMTPHYAVGVWVGNTVGPGTAGLQGTLSAAPVLFEVFRLLGPQSNFLPVPGLRLLEVSRESGFLPMPGTGKTVMVEAVAAAERSGRLSPYHHSANPNVFLLPPAQGYYYRQWNLHYSPPPSSSEAGEISILVPHAGATILLPTDYDGSSQQVVLEAYHSEETAVLDWHLNGTYLGRTRDPHTMAVHPFPGDHRLVIVDGKGAQAVRTFRVR